MWDLPGPGLEPMCPALAGRFLTTVPPGKPPGILNSSLYIQDVSLFFHIKCQEGEKLSFPSEIHLFSWPFPIISINSLLPLGRQQSIPLACFQSEISGNGHEKKNHQKPHCLLCMEVKC